MKVSEITLQEMTKGEYMLFSEAVEETGWAEDLLRGAHEQLGLPSYRLMGRFAVVSRDNLRKIAETLQLSLPK